MIQAYIEYWKEYFNWSGRTIRKSFWWVFITNLAIVFTLILLCIATTGTAVILSFDFEGFNVATYIFGSLLILWSLATFIPSSMLGIRRVRDAGLNPWLWLLSPTSSILGGFNSFPAEIVSDILFLIFLGLALMPSKKGRIIARSQSQGLLIIAIGLIALGGFSVVNLPAKAEHIVEGLPKTPLVVKTTMIQELKLPIGISESDKQSLINIYTTVSQKGEIWELSADKTYLYRKTTPESDNMSINGKSYETNSEGEVSTKINTDLNKGQVSINTTQYDESLRTSINGKNTNNTTITLSKSKNIPEVVNIKKVVSIDEYLDKMDSVGAGASVKPTSFSNNIFMNSNDISMMSFENKNIIFLPLAGMRVNVGDAVTCNRFNGFLGDQKYYNKLKQPVEALRNFFSSDCDFALGRSSECLRDYEPAGSRYCADNVAYKKGRCSKIIGHSIKFHKHTNYWN